MNERAVMIERIAFGVLCGQLKRRDLDPSTADETAMDKAVKRSFDIAEKYTDELQHGQAKQQ
jgi:hypothetical protein